MVSAAVAVAVAVVVAVVATGFAITPKTAANGKIDRDNAF